jgi:neutral ceramidase
MNHFITDSPAKTSAVTVVSCMGYYVKLEFAAGHSFTDAMLHRVLAFVLAAGFLASSSSAPAQTAVAGWAEVDITPPLGIGLGGRAGPGTVAKKVLDPLSAQVTYLKDAKGTGFVLVSFDLVAMPHEFSDRVRFDIVNELGVDWNLVLLNVSHTHSGPYTIRSLFAGLGEGPLPKIEADYFTALEQRIISATRAAAKSLKQVKVEVFEGTSDIGINRRGRNKQGKMTMLANAKAPYDEHVWTMKLTPANGDPPALIFSYACHAVIAYGIDYAAISADFPGVARHHLREALGAKSHPQFVQGFAGNIRPRSVADLEKGVFRKPTPADLERTGSDLAKAVLDSMKRAGRTLSLDIIGASDRPFLPRDKPPPREQYETMHTEGVEKKDAYHIAVSEYWLKRYDSGEGFAKGDAWALGLIRLADDQWIVHSSGEPVVEWRNKIAQWLTPLHIVPFGYCQEAKSYLPTEALLPEGGYEVLDSNNARANTPAPFAPGIEAAIKQSLLRQLAFIKAKAK